MFFYPALTSPSDYDSRKDEIRQELVDAAETAGFLTLVDHGLTPEEIEAQFDVARRFFDLPHEVKGKTPYASQTNSGWEFKAQLRPSTGTYDQKESLWLNRNSQWPSDEDVTDFNESTRQFMAKCAEISNRVCELFSHAALLARLFALWSCANILFVSESVDCFSLALGFPEDYFRTANDVTKEDCLTQLRLIHYPACDYTPPGSFRAGSHTDIGCLTLLFQREGEDGLEVCPGRESSTSFAKGDTFFPVPAHLGPIVVNIGDMLMAWSDDRLKSNFHQVRAKASGATPSRYSMAYFNQGRASYVMQGPKKKYPPVTCKEWLDQAVKKNFRCVKASSSCSRSQKLTV